MWIKTCLTPEGSRVLVCDPCYGEHASVLVIVPGDRTVTARCDSCWRYGNPREFAEVSPGGRKNAYSRSARSARTGTGVRMARENPSAVSSKKREAPFHLRILITLDLEIQEVRPDNVYRILSAVSQAVVLFVKSR
jgi:hypothetical protein